MRKGLILLSGIFLIVIATKWLWMGYELKSRSTPQLTPEPTPSPSPTPVPSPLTFNQMNQLYGPCVVVSTLMYHHVLSQEQADKDGVASLTVATETFRKQMEYLRERGYTVIGMEQLIGFFDRGETLGKKSVLLTFDDGYEDFFSNALPILKEFGYRATVFTATGLINNPGYLSWGQVKELGGAGMTIGNHTWSHRNVGGAKEVAEKEISLADTQLNEQGLNAIKVFAYPYGFGSSAAEKILSEKGYSLAFTTRPGSTLCRGQRLELPRVRIGNGQLSSYGL